MGAAPARRMSITRKTEQRLRAKMKLVLTHKGLDAEKDNIHLVIPVQAESVDAVRGHFATVAEDALLSGRDTFEVYGHRFHLTHVMPPVQPELELRIANLARSGHPVPRVIQGPKGRRHVYRGATVQTLDDWFSTHQKFPSAAMLAH
jgi:hypothetical protein